MVSDGLSKRRVRALEDRHLPTWDIATRTIRFAYWKSNKHIQRHTQTNVEINTRINTYIHIHTYRNIYLNAYTHTFTHTETSYIVFPQFIQPLHSITYSALKIRWTCFDNSQNSWCKNVRYDDTRIREGRQNLKALK